MDTPEFPSTAPSDRWTAWDRFLESTDEAGFMQSSWWAEFRTTVGFDHFGSILKSNNSILGGAIVQKYRFAPDACFYYIQEGPVLPCDNPYVSEIFEALMEDIEAHRREEFCSVSHLRIEPRWTSLPNYLIGFSPLAAPDRFAEPRRTLCVDLRRSEEEILVQMKPKGRYNIHLAQKYHVQVVEDSSEAGLEDFLEMYEEMTERHGIGAKPRDYFYDLMSIASPCKRASLFFAEYYGIRLAAALVIFFERRATYFYGCSRSEYRNVMAPYLLHFEIMKHARALGHEWYDFWGVSPIDDPNHRWHNISVFKRKFGGVEIPLVTTLDYIFDQKAYNLYRASLQETEHKQTILV